MARPIKKGIDYFSHDVTSGKTIFTLESKFGNDGYAFWFKLLEILGSQEDLSFRTENPANWLFLVAKTRVNEETAIEILNLLSALGAIDSELWSQKIIWCQKFSDRLREVYLKRKVEMPKKPSFRIENPTITVVSAPISTQSKVKESKVNKSKVNKSTETPPPPPEIENPKEPKHKYGALKNVLLTDAEYERLKVDYPDTADQAIEFLSEYIKMKRYKADDHNLALRKWVFNALKEKEIKAAELMAREERLKNNQQKGEQPSGGFKDKNFEPTHGFTFK